jgi:triosephosphate isomerase (TIM)
VKKKIFAANWKMNKSFKEAQSFCQSVKAALSSDFYNSAEVFIFPQNFSLAAVAEGASNTSIQFGPQQIHKESKGAFTGENSLDLAIVLGSKICLIGHSERRQFFAETDELVNHKIKLCQSQQVRPVFCIGETLAQREQNQTEKVCEEQLSRGLFGVDKQKNMVIAYEPVWAIGTGKVATNEQVKSVHQFIFEKMTGWGFTDFQILYGGSVKADNAKELISIPYVDGFLIGGASLEAESFINICQA